MWWLQTTSQSMWTMCGHNMLKARLRIPGAAPLPHGREREQIYTTKNHAWQAGCPAPNNGVSSKQPSHQRQEKSVQLICPVSYDIWCRDLTLAKTSQWQTCGSTYQNGKTYAQRHSSARNASRDLQPLATVAATKQVIENGGTQYRSLRKFQYWQVLGVGKSAFWKSIVLDVACQLVRNARRACCARVRSHSNCC